ncbi:hypothetical protein [Streptomyces sp. NBC_00239]|uniref:hypothetical protein n=1 Tax=Streptomyces sp. NBC_00239 TaxID=2903640 RepID=UPI002E2DB5CD|nr:hypothetical protein [Streptomyces sp. NBC_00239]
MTKTKTKPNTARRAGTAVGVVAMLAAALPAVAVAAPGTAPAVPAALVPAASAAPASAKWCPSVAGHRVDCGTVDRGSARSR